MTDPNAFETTLERRLAAHAATAVRPVDASAIARSTIGTAATRVDRASTLRGPHRPAFLLGLAAVLLLATVAGAAFVGRLSPVIQGVFVPGPSLDEGHFASALALPDGRVLVGVQPDEGTVPGTTTLDCSDPCRPHLMLLEPRSGVFTPTQEQPTSLNLGAMAPLHDGRVLILRGSADDPDASGAMLYDPVADRFEEVGPPVEARTWPFLVTLADGRVLVVGGQGAQSALATTELFDPATGSFSPAGSLTRPRGFGAGAVLLPDGHVLVVGGGPEVRASAELFDPVSATFAPTGDMTVTRGGFLSTTLLPDGRVLLAGGLVPDAANPTVHPDMTATAEVYDPVTGSFTAVGSMAAPRAAHAASILVDGTVLVAGGTHDILASGTPVAASDAEIFDPATGTFRTTGDLARPRLLPAVVSTDDRVLLLGQLDPLSDDPDAGSSSEWFE